VLRTAELDAGNGSDAATDHVDEQCRAATNQQLSHPRSQVAAAVEDTDHRPDGEQGEARKTIAAISAVQPDENMYGRTTTTAANQAFTVAGRGSTVARVDPRDVLISPAIKHVIV
jgi:selenocysteine lyase/cysteine desulfurase